MLTLVANGYVTGEVKVDDGDYGRRGVVSLRAKTSNGKEVHYINATFYGKKIDTVSRFMEDGRLVTIVGSVKSILHKVKKDGTKYVSVYMDASDFTLPERQSDQPSDSTSNRPAQNRFNEEPDEDEVPF